MQQKKRVVTILAVIRARVDALAGAKPRVLQMVVGTLVQEVVEGIVMPLVGIPVTMTVLEQAKDDFKTLMCLIRCYSMVCTHARI